MLLESLDAAVGGADAQQEEKEMLDWPREPCEKKEKGEMLRQVSKA